MDLFDKKSFSHFKYERFRLDRELLNLNFLISCRKMNIIPAFLKNRNKFSNLYCARLCRQFELKCLILCIRRKYAYINILQKRTFDLYNKFASSTPPYIFDVLMRSLDKYRYEKSSSKEMVQHNKIVNLSRIQKFHTTPVCQPVVFLNISNRPLNEEEVKVLQRGPKYIFPLKLNINSVIPQLESIVQSSDYRHKEEIRNIMYHELSKLIKQPTALPKKELNILMNLKKDPDIILIQTDKSNKLSILNTADYKHKMLECINNMECIEVKKNPLNKINQKVSELVNKGCWPDDMKGVVKVNKLALIPTIVGRLKDHKTGMPLRPIVTKCSGPTYYIEKAFVILLKSILPHSDRVIKSTSDFIQRLSTVQFPENYLLASLDVVSLYPSVDCQKVINRINNRIDSMENINEDMKTTLKRALNLIINNNYFMFDQRIYIQNNGAPMGSPISGLLAEFILRPLEEEVYNTFDYTPQDWFRYVDDILIVWQHAGYLLDTFMHQLNQLDPRIKFTLEVEQQGKLPFLDVLLIKTPHGIERSVYRKPIANQHTIPQNAQAPHTYKISAFRSFVKRAFTVCTADRLMEELDMIRDVARRNGYKESIINRLIMSMNDKRNTKFNEQNAKIYTLQYFPNFFERLKYKLHHFNICLIAKPSPNIISMVCRKIDQIQPDQLSGVYEIPFTKTDGTVQYYIGMTTRMFKTRKKEHIADIKYNRDTTALSRLSKIEPLQINFQESRIIYPSRSHFQSLIRESIEIYLRNRNICNEFASFDLPGIWREVLQKQKLDAYHCSRDSGHNSHQ